MKTFSLIFKNIYSGLVASEFDDKDDPGLSVCHNLVPIGEDYKVHELITDLNADGVSWGGLGEFHQEVWADDSDTWEDDSDIWLDS